MPVIRFEKDGATTALLFVRPFATGEGSAAEPGLRKRETKVIAANNAGLYQSVGDIVQ